MPVPRPSSTARTVFHQAGWLVAGLAAAKGIDFLLYVLLARALGVEAFGRFTFALSFSLLFAAFADLGISTVYVRRIARDPGLARELLGPSLAIKLLLGLVTAIAVFLAAGWARTSGASLTLMVPIVGGMVCASAAMPFDGLLRASGRAGASGLAAMIQALAGLVAGVSLLGGGLGAQAGALAYLVGGVSRIVASAWASRDLWAGQPLKNAGWGVQAALIREALPLALSGLFTAIYFRIDAVVLQTLQGERAVGLYGAIYRVFELFCLLAVTFRSVLFPLMARAADGPPEALGVLCWKSIRMHLLFTLGVAVFFTFHAGSITRNLLGPSYHDAARGLAILVWALPAAYMADTLLFLHTARRTRGVVLGVAALTAAVNVGLNLLLVPVWSLHGSAAATVASEWLCFGLLLTFFLREVPVPGLCAMIWRPLAAGGLLALGAGLTASWAPDGPPGLALMALLTVVAYGLLLGLLGAVRREDLVRVRELMPSRVLRKDGV